MTPSEVMLCWDIVDSCDVRLSDEVVCGTTLLLINPLVVVTSDELVSLLAVVVVVGEAEDTMPLVWSVSELNMWSVFHSG